MRKRGVKSEQDKGRVTSEGEQEGKRGRKRKVKKDHGEEENTTEEEEDKRGRKRKTKLVYMDSSTELESSSEEEEERGRRRKKEKNERRRRRRTETSCTEDEAYSEELIKRIKKKKERWSTVLQQLQTLRRKARETRTSDSEEDVEVKKKKPRKNSTTEGESGSEKDAKSLSPEHPVRAEAPRKKITLVKVKNQTEAETTPATVNISSEEETTRETENIATGETSQERLVTLKREEEQKEELQINTNNEDRKFIRTRQIQRPTLILNGKELKEDYKRMMDFAKARQPFNEADIRTQNKIVPCRDWNLGTRGCRHSNVQRHPIDNNKKGTWAYHVCLICHASSNAMEMHRAVAVKTDTDIQQCPCLFVEFNKSVTTATATATNHQ